MTILMGYFIAES